MQCSRCGQVVADHLLQCGHCGSNVSFLVASPQGQQFGPYSLQSLRQYVAEGRIPPDCMVSLGGSPWSPLQQALGVAPAPAYAAMPAPQAAPMPQQAYAIGSPPAPATALPAPAPAGAEASRAAFRARKRKKTIMFWAAIAGVLVLLAVGAVVGFSMLGRQGAPGGGGAIAAADLLAEFAADKNAAGAKYKGKVVTVSGPVYYIGALGVHAETAQGSGILKLPCVALSVGKGEGAGLWGQEYVADPFALTGVLGYIARGKESQFAGLQQGQEIKIRGKVGGAADNRAAGTRVDHRRRLRVGEVAGWPRRYIVSSRCHLEASVGHSSSWPCRASR